MTQLARSRSAQPFNFQQVASKLTTPQGPTYWGNTPPNLKDARQQAATNFRNAQNQPTAKTIKTTLATKKSLYQEIVEGQANNSNQIGFTKVQGGYQFSYCGLTIDTSKNKAEEFINKIFNTQNADSLSKMLGGNTLNNKSTLELINLLKIVLVPLQEQRGLFNKELTKVKIAPELKENADYKAVKDYIEAIRTGVEKKIQEIFYDIDGYEYKLDGKQNLPNLLAVLGKKLVTLKTENPAEYTKNIDTLLSTFLPATGYYDYLNQEYTAHYHAFVLIALMLKKLDALNVSLDVPSFIKKEGGLSNQTTKSAIAIFGDARQSIVAILKAIAQGAITEKDVFNDKKLKSKNEIEAAVTPATYKHVLGDELLKDFTAFLKLTGNKVTINSTDALAHYLGLNLSMPNSGLRITPANYASVSMFDNAGKLTGHPLNSTITYATLTNTDNLNTKGEISALNEKNTILFKNPLTKKLELLGWDAKTSNDDGSVVWHPHSSAVPAVLWAGEMVTKQGLVAAFNSKSGHMKPGNLETLMVYTYLNQRNLLSEQVVYQKSAWKNPEFVKGKAALATYMNGLHDKLSDADKQKIVDLNNQLNVQTAT